MFKMESWWDVLPPELQEFILKIKQKMEHQDNMKALAEEIGEFYLQPLSDDGNQGDSCCFLLSFFSCRKASHLSLDSPCCHPGHQSALQKQIWTVPVQQMSPISQNSKLENLYVIRPLPSLFCSCLS